ncbi:MAG: hypothetical protein O7E57_13200 [Gammaproteobacteria bacterium]|nr:hypothetical protein [Gammaproteobacteria bacterium]
MSLATLEKIAGGLSLLVIGSAIWFYSVQILDVLELLELAYG